MWKNKKVLIIALVAAVLVIASIGGVALARAGAVNSGQPKTLADVTGNTTQPRSLLARVAEILGIDQQTLEAAVKQAKAEQQLEVLKNRLQKLVEAGKITQAQADAYLSWVQSKPDLGPYQQQLKEWAQARPSVPQELKDWQQTRPDVPLQAPGARGPRGMRQPGGMRGMIPPRLPAQ
ncbi:MAG: hypothetical protein HYX80_01250 [Chloroflexi bacterium]|nr:hypothetical protein [Chloroflexota bacterium]